MSFFIRKKSSYRDLSAPSSSDYGKTKLKNKDAKKRPLKRERSAPGTSGSRRGNNKFGGARNNNNNFVPGPPEGKKLKFDPNEEIESSSDDEDEGRRKRKIEEDEEREKFISAEEAETPQEKKLRLAQLYLEEIAKEERERQENEIDDDATNAFVSSRLHEDVLESEGRLRREVSHKINPTGQKPIVLTSPKYLKKSVTCLCVHPNDEFIFSACKDGHLYKWSVIEKSKVDMVKKKDKLSTRKKKNGRPLKVNSNPNACHSSPILSMAISSDGKFLATGDKDRQIVIWDPNTLKRLHIFTGHRGPIRSLVFRKKSHTLYSCSDDRSVRIWSLDEMGYVETLFGHQDAVTSVDALTRERAITAGGRDNSIRVWKIVEESQLVYNGHYNGSIDAVKLINEENFLSAGDDGNLCTWNVNRKKPLFSVESAHGKQPTPEGCEVKFEHPRWISSITTWNNTDLVASGSCDGFIRFWQCGERFKTLTPVAEVPCLGWVNSMEFSHGSNVDTKFLVVGIGKEHKLGRWSEDIKAAKNSIVIIPLCPKSEETNISTESLNGDVDVNVTTEDESESS